MNVRLVGAELASALCMASALCITSILVTAKSKGVQA
jgi:hypothetical protein